MGLFKRRLPTSTSTPSTDHADLAELAQSHAVGSRSRAPRSTAASRAISGG